MDGKLHARIENISIRGFRSLADVELEGLPPVAVLIGANGSGKSNVMRFFEMLGWMLRSSRLGDFVQKQGGADDQLFQGRRRTMRTTLDIDDDVLSAAKALAAHECRPPPSPVWCMFVVPLGDSCRRKPFTCNRLVLGLVNSGQRSLPRGGWWSEARTWVGGGDVAVIRNVRQRQTAEIDRLNRWSMSSRITGPIVEEARRVRTELGARHGNDIAAIVRYARELERTLVRPCVRYPPRPVVRAGWELAATEEQGYNTPPLAKVMRPARAPPRSAPRESS